MPKELSILDENGNDSSDEYFEGRISELKAYLKENFGITEELLREKLENYEIDEVYNQLRLYIHSMAYGTNCEIKSNLEHIFENFNINLDTGNSKRFFISFNEKDHVRTFEVNTLVEMLDIVLDYKKNEILDDYIFILKRWNQLPENFTYTTDSPILDLFNLVKEKTSFILESDIAGELYILSHYKNLPALTDPIYLDKVVLRIEEVNNRIKKGLPGGDYLMSFWDD